MHVNSLQILLYKNLYLVVKLLPLKKLWEEYITVSIKGEELFKKKTKSQEHL